MKKVITILALLATTAGAWADEGDSSSTTTIKMYDSSGNMVTAELDSVGTYSADGNTYASDNDTQYSCFYAVPTDSTLTLTFVNHNNGANSNSWENFEVGVTPDSAKNDNARYLFLRSDGNGWSKSYDGPNVAQAGFDYLTYASDMDGASVTVKVANDNDTATVTTIAVSADQTRTMVQQIPIWVEKDSTLRVYLTVEDALLTNIKSSLADGYDTSTPLSAAPSYVLDEDFERTTAGCLQISNSGWWSFLSSEYQLTPDSTVTLEFNNYSRCENQDDNFVVVLTNDASEQWRDNNGYKEYYLLHAPGTCAIYNDASATTITTYNMDSTLFSTDNSPMNGARIKVKAAYNKDGTVTLTTTATNDDYEYVIAQQVKVTLPSSETSGKLRMFLTVYNSYIDSLSSSKTEGVDTLIEGVTTKDYIVGGYESSMLSNSACAIGFNTIYTCAYQVPEEFALTLNFTNNNVGDGADTWDNFILYVVSDADSYTELVVLRADHVYGTSGSLVAGDGGGLWGDKTTKTSDYSIVTTDSTTFDQAAFKRAIQGASVEAVVVNRGDSINITITTISADTKTTIVQKLTATSSDSYTLGGNIRVMLSQEDAFLSDITSSLSYVRTVTAEGAYGTICLPYAATTDSATVYEVVGYSTENDTPKDLYLQEVDSMEAGKGYVFMSSKAGDIEFVLSGSKVSEAVSGALVGNLSSDTVTVDSVNYILTIDTYGNYVWGKGEGNKVGQYKAYLNLSNIQSTTTAKAGWIKMSLLTDGSDGSTGIREITTEEESATEDDVIYNLSGMRVTNPQKGIYIKNGKKYIIK